MECDYLQNHGAKPEKHPTSPRESSSPDISVIIPTLNEEERLAATLQSVMVSSGVEVIVADGSSQDATAALARSFGIRVITTAAGRARQLNAGALAASGEILLFLHGDTRLPERFDQHVLELLSRSGTVAGAFELSIEGEGIGLRIIEILANFRSRRLQLPYGDQGIFLRAGLFRSLGGFPDMPIMEDFALMKRLKKLGLVAIAPVAVITSARRWLRMGVWKTTLINQVVLLAYLFGRDPGWLANWYGRRK